MPEKRSKKKQADADSPDKLSALKKRRRKGDPDAAQGVAAFLEFPDSQPAASAPDRRIELYEQQLRNLRAELEHIKLQSILQGLNASEKIEIPQDTGEDFDASFFAAAYYPETNGECGHANPIEEWGSTAPTVGYESPFPIPRRKSLQKLAIPPDSSAMSMSVSLAAQLSAAIERTRTLEKFLHYLAAKVDAGQTGTDASRPPSSSEAILAEMYMVAEKKIETLQNELLRVTGLEKENRSLRSMNENLAGELRAIISDIDSRFTELSNEQCLKLEAEFSQKSAKQQSELEKMGSIVTKLNTETRVAKKMISERDAKIAAYEKAIDDARKAEEEKNSGTEKYPEAAMSDETPPGPELEAYISALISNPSLESILRVRSYFLKTRRHTHGVKTYMELLDRMKDRKLLPALCVLIGEIYLEMGRKPEAEYYLNSRMVRDDALALSLLKNIPADISR